MESGVQRAGRVVALLVAGLVGLGVGVVVFVAFPGSMAELVGVVLALLVALTAVRVAGNWTAARFATYDVGEVHVHGPITRSGVGDLPSRPAGVPAGELVRQIERADDDPNVEALVVRLNTPGGEIVPSDDVRAAVAAFDGPTVAYATDVCASGGYWVATGCDHVVAREGSLVGSIGVISSTLNLADLADRVGVTYERLAAGRYKDAGAPLKEFTEDDRRYLQGLTDDYYDRFVAGVAEARDLDPEAVRETEARLFLGEEAHNLGLVDELGDEDAVEAYLEAVLGHPVERVTFEPALPLLWRFQSGVRAVAHAAGAGAMSVLVDDQARPR